MRPLGLARQRTVGGLLVFILPVGASSTVGAARLGTQPSVRATRVVAS
jgi:hypothetical protein